MLLQRALSFGFERANQVSSALCASCKHTGNDRAVLEEDSLLRWVRRTKGFSAYLINDSFPIWVQLRAFSLEVFRTPFCLDAVNNASDPEEPLGFWGIFDR